MINKKYIAPILLIVSMLLSLSLTTGCISGNDAPASDYVLINILPGYVDGSLYADILGTDPYSILEFDPTEYELYNESTGEYYYLDSTTAVPNIDLELTLDIKNSPKDLYFIFTNISLSAYTDYPEFYTPDAGIQQSSVSASTVSKQDPVLTGSDGTRGKPEVTEFNRNPYAFLNKINPVNALLSLVPSSQRVADVAGTDPSQGYFQIDRYSQVAATCRYVSPSPVTTALGEKTLNIWVADNCWDDDNDEYDGNRIKLVNQDMVNDMAEKFLAADLENDIYDWVTAIYGEEWGEISSSSPLSEEDRTMLIMPDNEITILLFDIDNDNYNPYATKGYVLGYFWAKDNFNKSAISYSNERIMFYLDAVLYATNDRKDEIEQPWSIDAHWPSEIISTLAHEFQHMIQFYQKTVLLTDGSSGTETWIDEMCSLATEDLVSNKLYVNGPRGADYLYSECKPAVSDPGYAAGYISQGRLPLANFFNEYSMTIWYGGDYNVVSYSLNYAFGSYLSRNYGGAEFFSNVVHNPYTDYRAIEYAVEASGLSVDKTIATMLRRWAATSILSDKYDTSGYYDYNNGPDPTNTNWFPSTASSITYGLGSINLYKYRYNYYDGPYIYTEMPAKPMWPASNIYYFAGTIQPGTQTWNIKLRSNVRLTVVARD